jgi:hypothetical protein
MRTPPKRAPYRSREAGTVRDRPEIRQLSGRITMSDREVPRKCTPSRLIARQSGAAFSRRRSHIRLSLASVMLVAEKPESGPMLLAGDKGSI